MTAVYCWAHVRRYFWNCRDTHPSLAMEALGIIAQLFDVERTTKSLARCPGAPRSEPGRPPVLTLFDQWVERIRPKLEPRTPLQAAITYHDNQREGLRRFLDDGHDCPSTTTAASGSYSQSGGRAPQLELLRKPGRAPLVVLHLPLPHRLVCSARPRAAAHYLDEILRLAPHWPTTRLLELSPKYWPATRASSPSIALRSALRFETTTHRAADSPLAPTSRPTSSPSALLERIGFQPLGGPAPRTSRRRHDRPSHASRAGRRRACLLELRMQHRLHESSLGATIVIVEACCRGLRNASIP